MNTYSALVEGRNFIISIDNNNQRIGFVTTFILSAETESEIIPTIKHMLYERLNENKIKLLEDNTIFKGFVTLNELYSISGDKKENIGGFTLYNMSRLDSFWAFIEYKLISLTKKILIII